MPKRLVICANPVCSNPARIGKNGKPLLYCENENCRKQAWYYRHLSRECRETSLDIQYRLLEMVESFERRLNDLPQQLPLFSSPLQHGEGQGVRSNPAPIDDSFDIEIKAATRDADNNSTYNFLLASALNVFGNYDGLAPEVIEYGLRTGRINPAHISLSPSSGGQGGVAGGEVRGPKAMSVPTSFEIPDYDDIEIGVA